MARLFLEVPCFHVDSKRKEKRHGHLVGYPVFTKYPSWKSMFHLGGSFGGKG